MWGSVRFGYDSKALLLRALLVVLVLTCFVSLQATSAAETHPHAHGGAHDHCCAACHVSHTSILRATVAFELTRPCEIEWHSRATEKPAASIQLADYSPSRAPPVQL